MLWVWFFWFGLLPLSANLHAASTCSVLVIWANKNFAGGKMDIFVPDFMAKTSNSCSFSKHQKCQPHSGAMKHQEVTKVITSTKYQNVKQIYYKVVNFKNLRISSSCFPFTCFTCSLMQHHNAAHKGNFHQLHLLYCEHLRSLKLWQRFPLSLLVELNVLHDTGSEELKPPGRKKQLSLHLS